MDSADLAQRFHNSYTRLKANECWLWGRSCLPNGYGRFVVEGQPLRAHRVAYALRKKRHPGQLDVLHRCFVKNCVNPAHLWLGDSMDRNDAAYAAGRQNRFTSEDRGGSHLRDADVLAIRQRIKAGETNTDIADDYGLTHSAISCIRRQRSWSRTA